MEEHTIDQGTVAKNLEHNTCTVQICRWDLGDGDVSVFLTACQPRDDRSLPDTPVSLDEPDRTWVECTNPQELEELIREFTEQLKWLRGPRTRPRVAAQQDRLHNPLDIDFRKEGEPRFQVIRMGSYTPQDGWSYEYRVIDMEHGAAYEGFEGDTYDRRKDARAHADRLNANPPEGRVPKKETNR